MALAPTPRCPSSRGCSEFYKQSSARPGDAGQDRRSNECVCVCVCVCVRVCEEAPAKVSFSSVGERVNATRYGLPAANFLARLLSNLPLL